MIDLAQYLDLFIAEASQNNQDLQASLANLESRPSKADLEKAIRAAHTLKGLARTMQHDAMATIATFLEEYLRLLETKFELLEGEHPFAPLNIASRALQVILDDITAGNQPSLTSLEFLDELALG